MQRDSRDPATATFSVDQAATMLGVSRSTAYRAASDGELPAIRLRGRLLVPRERLMAFLNGDTAQPPGEQSA